MNAYVKAVQAVLDRHRADLDNGYMIWQDALNSDDKLYSAFKAYQTEMIKSAKGEKNNIDKTRTAVKKRLNALGITEDMIQPKPHCTVCGDTGYANGKLCGCVIRAVIQSDKENLTLPLTDFAEMKKSAPKAIAGVYKAAQGYIDGNDKRFLILSGSSGTGKTVLAAAVATEFMQKGNSVVTVTAFDFVRRALDYHTQFSIANYTDRFTPMLDCDVLVIDDLGTESTLKNVTKEYLYTVINERWRNNKYTIITTNLSPAELNGKYGESIFSRLSDKRISELCYIEGKNARL